MNNDWQLDLDSIRAHNSNSESP